MLKISILYYSKSGNTKAIAEIIAEGIREVQELEVKIIDVENVDYEYLMTSKAVIFGTPTYIANMAWQMKKWFDESVKYSLEGKIGAAFATENYLGGGADTALLTIINHMMARGMLVYSGGTALGQPYIHLGAVALKSGDEMQRERAKIFGRRIAEKTKELFEK